MKLTVSVQSFVVSSKNVIFMQEINTALQALICTSVLNFILFHYLPSNTNNVLTALIPFRISKKSNNKTGLFQSLAMQIRFQLKYGEILDQRKY
jgi:hypothetical protein